MYYIGLMSGTSADGIDAALIEIDAHGGVSVSATYRHPYPAALGAKIDAAIVGTGDRLRQIALLDVELGAEFAAATSALLRRCNLSPDSVRAIGSHGQTVGHFPEAPFPATVQLGCPAVIAERTGIPAVSDFRSADLAAGGQGAPLAPAFHRAAFHSHDEDRVIVNVGGIANLTVLPQDPAAPVVGFDTGPGNTLLDAWIRRQRGLPYDPQGEWAASGRVDTALLENLLKDEYFQVAPPKSTGRERFNLRWLDAAREAHARVVAADVQATLTRLTACTIAEGITAQAPAAAVYLCGGGVHNRTLVNELRRHLPERRVEDTRVLGMHPDWIEAVAFAWLAHRCVHGLSGNLPSVTGARREVVLGAIWQPTRGATRQPVE